MSLSLILILAAATTQTGDDSAVKLFRQMEVKLRAAKTVKVVFTTETHHEGETLGRHEGVLLLGTGNRARFESRGRWLGGSTLFVSDGKSLVGSGARAPEQGEASALLRHDLLMRFVVLGPSYYPPWTAGIKGATIETEKGLRVQRFKLQPDEKVGGRSARVVRYDYGVPLSVAPPVTLWIDAQTHLPLKRRFGTVDNGLTETYTEVTLEPPIDAAAFDLKPVRAARAEAEKWFRAMEKKVREADTLRVVVEQGNVYQTEYMARGRDYYKYKGQLLLGDGQKARLELTGQRDGKENSDLVIADGKQLIGSGERIDTRGKPVPQAPTFTALCGQYTARLGLLAMFGAEGVRGEKYDIDKHIPADNFHLGPREKAGGREAQVIEYHVQRGDYRHELILWLDVETNLPLKRITWITPGGLSRTTEVYSEFTVNPRLGPDQFVLPKM